MSSFTELTGPEKNRSIETLGMTSKGQFKSHDVGLEIAFCHKELLCRSKAHESGKDK